MRRRLCPVVMLLLLLGAAMLPVTLQPTAAQEPGEDELGLLSNAAENIDGGSAVSGNTYTSQEFGYTVTWDDPWAAVEGSSGGGYDVLHLQTAGGNLFWGVS